jgi:hypothetical protein
VAPYQSFLRLLAKFSFEKPWRKSWMLVRFGLGGFFPAPSTWLEPEDIAMALEKLAGMEVAWFRRGIDYSSDWVYSLA